MTLLDENRVEAEAVSRTGYIPPHQRNAPFFGPLDVVAGLAVVVMIWGPLVAGAFRG